MLRQLPTSFPNWQGTFRHPTIKLEDSFYFPVSLPFQTLAEMVQYLSDRYLGKSPFHIRLETTQGDTYLALTFRELRYFFQQQRDHLWMLDLYSATLDGQHLFLRLWFHPLSKDPNAHVQLVSHQAEEILDNIHHTIGIQAPGSTEQTCLHQAFSYQGGRFRLEDLVRFARRVSDYELNGSPPIGIFATDSGMVQTGLSTYQLLKLWPEYRHQIRELSINVSRLITGQTLSISCEF